MNSIQTKNVADKFHLSKTRFFRGFSVIVFGLSLSHFAMAKTATEAAKASDSTGTQTFQLDAKKSTLEWGGSKIVGDAHKGTISIKDGSVEFVNNSPTKAEVTVLMNTIKNTDIKDAKNNKKLVGHLNSDDFFSTQKFPTAQISIKSFEPTQENQYVLKGDLTIKGITKPVQAKASITESTQGKKVILADLEFDRTDYDVRYGSGKFFDNLGDKVISDKVQLKASLSLFLKK